MNNLVKVTDVWIDHIARDEQDGSTGKVGYKINFNREYIGWNFIT